MSIAAPPGLFSNMENIIVLSDAVVAETAGPGDPSPGPAVSATTASDRTMMFSMFEKSPGGAAIDMAGEDDEPTRRPRRSFRQWLSWFDLKASPYLYISPFFLLFTL